MRLIATDLGFPGLLVFPIAILIPFMLWRLLLARSMMWKLAREGKPMPRHSFIFGHLNIIKEMLNSHPSDAHIPFMITKLGKQFKNAGIFYLDFYPVTERFMVVTSGNAAIQAMKTSSNSILPKPTHLVRKYFRPITGGVSLADAPDDIWKPMRTLFNPGFSSSATIVHVPSVVDVVQVFCAHLRQSSLCGQIFQLDPKAMRLLLDIIGKVIMNADLRCQDGYNEFGDTFLDQISTHSKNREDSILQRLSPLRPLIEWKNNRRIVKYLRKHLEHCWQEFKDRKEKGAESKNVVDLAFARYSEEWKEKKGALPEELDQSFINLLMSQIRIFFLGGYASTSSALIYCYHMLHKHPHVKKRLCEEHDRVFSSKIDEAAQILQMEPSLIEKIPYTHAVIKETLRMYPSVTYLRTGRTGVSLTDDDGHEHPTEGFEVWILPHGIGRDPNHFVRPDDFFPERWLAAEGDPMRPTKGIPGAFGMGYRNCIGQTLAMVNLKVILVMTSREFDIRPAYEEWDRVHPQKGLNTFDEERVYQMELVVGRPASLYPCIVVKQESICT